MAPSVAGTIYARQAMLFGLAIRRGIRVSHPAGGPHLEARAKRDVAGGVFRGNGREAQEVRTFRKFVDGQPATPVALDGADLNAIDKEIERGLWRCARGNE